MQNLAGLFKKKEISTTEGYKCNVYSNSNQSKSNWIKSNLMAANVSDEPLRLFDSDLTPLTSNVSFNGKKYKMHIQITAFGSFTNQMTDYVSFLTGYTTSTSSAIMGQAATDHFRKIVSRCPDLQHGSRQLRDYFQVCLATCHNTILITQLQNS